MVTTKKDPTVPAPVTTEWNGEMTEVMGGLDIRDKAELVGLPFRMTGFKPSLGARDIAYMYVEAEDRDGNKFTFNDSSSGVKAQAEAFLTSRPDIKADADGWFNLSIIAPRGLRFSEYDVKDDRGKDKKARTYYITTSGTRA